MKSNRNAPCPQEQLFYYKEVLMIKRKVTLYCLFFFIALSCSGETVSHAMSLKEAMDIAVAQHRQTAISRALLEGAEGDLLEEGSYAYNPELSLEPQRRVLRDKAGRYNDIYITLSQGIETAGKQGFRRKAAEQRARLAEYQGLGAEKQLRINAGSAYVELVIARMKYHVREQQFAIARTLLQAVKKQRDAGDVTSLQVNLIQSSLANALSLRSNEERALFRAESDFKVALSLSPSENLSPAMELPPLSTDWEPDIVSEEVVKNHPDFKVAETQERVFTEEANLASAKKIPDVTLSFMVADEVGDKLYKLGLSVPIPLFNTHSGAYKAAVAREREARLRKELLQSTLESKLYAALQRHTAAMKALKEYQEDNLKDAVANAELARKAYEAGELELIEAIVHINQSLDAELTGIEILHQAWLARIDLSARLAHPEYILY